MLSALAYMKLNVIKNRYFISKQNKAQNYVTRGGISHTHTHTCGAHQPTVSHPQFAFILFRVSGPSCIDSVERGQAVASAAHGNATAQWSTAAALIMQ